MATPAIVESLNNKVDHITEEDVKLIISKYCSEYEENIIANYSVHFASNKMLGFLADYFKVKVYLTNKKVLHFFIKAVSITNEAKAELVREWKLFEKESQFYSEIKTFLDVPGMTPWSPRLVTLLDNAMVFQDLNGIQYQLKNKFDRFDMAHTLQALTTLARFHASSIIFEVNKKRESKSPYKILDDFDQLLMGPSGYDMSCDWYIQCMTGALEALKEFSKYNEREINLINSQWRQIWSSALDVSDFASGQTNVICHRDLWNNNIMFHYKNGDNNELVPDNCLFVDFQAFRYQPPASDIMVLLCCNLDPKFREGNMETFLNFYYEELQRILANYNIDIFNVMPKDEFLISAYEQRKWGLVVCASLIPQFWIDDDLTTDIFCDNTQFHEILNKNKGHFIKTMMENDCSYKQKVMEIFEEIADRYCLNEIKKK